MDSTLQPYHEVVDTLGRELAERGCLGLVVVDASALAQVEDRYGTEALEEVRARLVAVLDEQRGKDYREKDLVVLDRPRGLQFLFFLDRKRRRSVPFSLTDLRASRSRLLSGLVPTMARCGFPYLKATPKLDVGYGLALHNPLLHPERIVRRTLLEARRMADLQRRNDELLTLERLQDVLLRERVLTAYQPILHLQQGNPLGYEALSRGPRGSGLEPAEALFGAAGEYGLLVELDRLCRKRALMSSGRVPSSARIFINTLPATMRDPEFRGKALISFLDQAQVAPNRIVIEITEKLVIENYSLFRETMAYFSALGMSFAVDDVGAGYSGLESIARLRPDFLKIDIALVRDVHESKVNQAMTRAIVSLGRSIGAVVIAEGIQSEQEAVALRELGIEFGQGFHLARPEGGTD
jgi:EAL domain-containing protein (putative c-di-GMP-specific phosphodiesterase class I)